MENRTEVFSKMQLGASFEAANEATERTKRAFEEKYGVDSATRTRRQWKNLVKAYGYDVVAAKEKLTKAEVKAKCKN